MNDFDRQREKIGRQLEEGFLTPTEHRRLVRAIARAEARHAEAKRERHNARLVLRRSLLRSLGRQSA